MRDLTDTYWVDDYLTYYKVIGSYIDIGPLDGVLIADPGSYRIDYDNIWYIKTSKIEWHYYETIVMDDKISKLEYQLGLII